MPEDYDPEADLETPEMWDAMFRELPFTNDWAEDLLLVARSQLGYHESLANYQLDEEENRSGYTRYGAWYGDPYGEWQAMFVAFCTHYAGIRDVSVADDCGQWVKELSQRGMLYAPEGFDVVKGDLVFFDLDADGSADHMGIVESTGGELRVIEGGVDGAVLQNSYSMGDARILGYGHPERP